MEIENILSELYRLGIKLNVVDNKLKVQATKEKIPKYILEDIRACKDELINYLSIAEKKSSHAEIKNIEEKDYYRLSSAQKRIYLLQQIDLDATAYNMPIIIRLGTDFDVEKIERAFRQLISRHESFRTSIIVVDNEPVQLISKNVAFELEELCIETTEVEQLRNKFIKPFDLSKAPFLRAAIVDIKGEDSFLMIDMHHIISDATTHAILEKEFLALFSGEELAPLPLQYKDYSEWQNSKEQQDLVKDQEQYWLNKFEGEIPVLNLPTDYVRPVMQSHDGATVSFVLSKEETEGIKSFTIANDLTLYMSLLSVYSILLSKLSGQDDIVVGTPIAGRNHADLENIVGMFINTLSIRNEVKGEETIREFVSSLKQTVLGAYENQNYQFEDLVSKLSVERDTSRNPIFDVMFNLLNQRDYSGNLVEESLNVHEKIKTKFDLNFKAIDFGDQILLIFQYNTRLFSKNSINRMICKLEKVVKKINKGDEKLKIKEIEIIPEKEKQVKLSYFNEKLECQIRNNTVQGRLNESYNKFKDKIAIETGDKYISYSELEARKRVVSNWIVGNAVKKESLVGILVDDRAQVIISILGIIDSSCIFVPIDINLPANRIKAMIETVGINYFVTCDKGLVKLNEILPGIKRENVFVYGKAVDIINIDSYENRSLCTDAVYIYFTSGSTGKPKAIAGKNESLVQFIDWEIDRFNVDHSFRVSQLINIGFDVYLRDIFLPLLSGATICIPLDTNIILDGFQLKHWINKKQITLVHCVPSVFNVFGNEYIEISSYMGLRYVLMSGEQILPANLIKWYSVFSNRIQLVNLYGPTETTLARTCYFIQPDDVNKNRLTIGQAITGSRIIILDKDRNVCEAGISGELYIRTAYSSLGYYKNSQMTREKFVDNPFKKDDNILLYRTGDVAIENSNGEIEIIGRIDHQVKIRGFRIELGEIESVLLKHENINESVVLAIEENNDKYLCAYVVCKEELSHEELRSYISLQLPDYMVPSHFVEIESLPLNPNGKVNRKALPSLQIKAGDDYVAPANEIEEKLVEIWSEVLNIEKEAISTTAKFFSIGGHSLKATVLISKIHKEIGVEFPLRDVFLHQTIKSQASRIEKSTKKEFVSIPKAKEQSNYPVSSAQKRIYLLQQFDLTSTVYNMPNIIPLGKEVDKSKIEDVFKQLINRHESFRTSIIVVDNEPVQIISKDVEFELEELSIERKEVENTRNKFIKPFDLSKAPFLRAAIVDVKGEDSLLMIDMHHIISDGTTRKILEQEFLALLLGEELAPLPLQYKDYSQWQNSKDQQDLIKDQEQYWLNKFEGEIPVLNLPTDYVRPLMQSHEGARVSFVLNKEETEGIKSFTKENDLTLYMSLLSIFSILLSKLSGQDDIVVGTPIAGRNHADLENIVGMFVNTLSIRNKVKGEETIRDFVSSLNQTVLGAYENQNYQFEDLVDKVSVDRDTSRNPIFDVMINLLNQTEHSEDISVFNNQERVHEIGISKFDLSLSVVDYGEQLLISFEYCTRLFKAETIDRFIVYYKQIVNQLARTSEIKISAIDILTEEEKHQLLYEFNNTKADYPKDKTVHQLFEEQVERTPENVAVHYEGNIFTYSELNRKANIIAHRIREIGIESDDIVTIFLDRSIETVFSMLGVLKSGGAYLPLDPDYPEDRIDFILNDSRSKIVISTKELSTGIKFDGNIICVEEMSVLENNFSNIEIINNSSDLCYIIYTSGTTGMPKGVMVEHKNLVRLFFNDKFQFDFSEKDVWTMFHSHCFDFSVWEMYGALLYGGKLIVIPKTVAKDVVEYYKLLHEEKVTVLNQTPSAFYNLSEIALQKPDKSLENLRYVIFGGEALKPNKLAEWFNIYSDVKLINMYGITETTVHVTYKEIGEYEIANNISNIGTSIPTLTTYVVDNNLKLVPKGVAGELLIGGAGLSRGYLGREDLTREKFIENPYNSEERLYRSGDLVKMQSDGELEYLGRIDDQVQLRGFRIELGEIENTLIKHESINECVVLAIEENNDKYLCAYIVSKEELNHEELRTYISEQLPEYMVPSYFVQLDELPLTSNGKVNRKVLPAPEIKAGDDYIAPSNEIEEKLLEIWSKVLNINKEDISVNANFFSIGGHSLKATVLTSNIHKEIGVEFPLREVFLHSTIKSQASRIEKSTKKEFVSIPKAKQQSNYPVSPAQKRLYLLQQFDLTSTAYNMPNLIPLGKEADKEKIEEVFKQLINRHESFRTSINIVDQNPVQIISKDVEFEIEKISIEKPEVENIRDKFIKPFDLSKAPFLRAAIVDIKGEESLLMIDMHHIISDGTSHTILEQEFQALISGEELAPLPLQYKDYSQWQNSKEQQELIKEQQQYWLTKFEGEIPVLNLPTDYVRPLMQSHEGAIVNFVLSKEETEGIKTFTKENNLTLYMSLLSVFNILLSKLTGQEDIIVGTPIAGRNHADLENIVGMFINTLSIRNEVKGEETIREFVSNLKQTVLGAYENQNYQFEDLVDMVSVERDTGRNPIFDVMFNLLNQVEHRADLTGLDNQNYNHTSGISKFDMNLTAVDYGEQLLLSFEYCTKLFKAETIDRFIVYYKQIVNQLARTSEIKISAIDILTEEEKHQLLYEFNNTKADYPKDKTVHQLFEEQVKKMPNNIALVLENDKMSYDELNAKSNQLARYLRRKGVQADSIVGIMVDRSFEMIIGIMGVLKAGGAYLPIDHDYPENRIKFILQDSEPEILLIQEKYLSIVEKVQKVLKINLNDKDLYHEIESNLEIINTTEDLIYIIYTSGSTGNPKGTLITHKGVVNYLFWGSKIYLKGTENIFPLYSSLSFDLTVTSLLLPLITGNKVQIYNEKENELLIENVFNDNKVDVVKLTPAHLKILKENKTNTESRIRSFIVGGEELSTDLAKEIYNKYKGKIEIYNEYGPTETVVGCMIYKYNFEEDNKLTLSIGKPISNTRIYILDKYNMILPINVVGELCVGGDGLARGYLGNEVLTKEKFISHPFKEGERIYRTGDLARWLPDGNIEFLGRIDQQVKIRGFRIELGEIESALLKHENIKESVVLAIEENNDMYLCAYVVCKEEFSHEELRAYMSGQLPEYMVPSYFVELESLPLTANGKVNRKALPAPEVKAGEDYVAPSNEIEENLLEIWSEVLNVPQEEISTTASFFAIGGHSLKATILVSKIHKELSVKLPLKEIFLQQTIKKMAVCISEVSKVNYSSIKLAEKREYHTLSSAQKRLYFIQQMDFQSLSYNMPIVIPLEDDIKIDSLENAFVDLVSRHESFRTSFITLNNEPVQRVYDYVDFKLDYKETTREQLEKDIKEYIRPFDLSKDILIRACLMHVSNEQSVLVVDMHHIISDGTTSNIVREDFLKLFNGEKIAPLKLQYKDFSNWQNKLIAKGGLKSQESYWKDLFSGDIPVLNLQTDYKRPESFTYKGDVCRFSLNEDEATLLKDLGKGMGSTLYMNILAVLNTLFYRFSNQEDIIIGSGIAGRQHSDLQGISGMFVNTLAMRNYPNGDKTYLDFLKEVSDNSIAAFENQDIQFEDLVDMLNIDRDISRNPLFDINMVVQNFEDISEDQREDDVITEEDSTLRSNFYGGTSKFDMIFFVSETVNTINISIEYYSDIFKRETIEKYIRCFKSIVSSVTKHPQVKLKEIELLSQEEKQQLLHEFNDTQSDYPKDKTIHELFEEQVDKAPDNIALVCDQEQITYRELDNRSNRIAQYLRYECEVILNESVGIYMDKGVNVIISILGILKSGCGYLPLSVSYPEERIKFMINDTSTRVIISEKQYVKEMNKFQWECSSFKVYLALDSFNIYGEQETQSSLNNRKLWEYVGDESVDEVTGGGWSSSYTGKPIPPEEMDEYSDNVLKKLEPLLTSQTRILEIGCASGISMFKLAPKVALYYGTDLSGTILQKNEERINSEGHSNIIQKRLSADEIDQVEEKDFDIIIINSVIQCFDGHNYLKKVIRKAIDLMKSEGLMFFGDIMDQDLKNELVKDLEEFKRTNTNKEYSTKTDLSEELFLSRGFWNDLKYEESSIERIETSRKIFTLENELTKYRYDVLISIDKNQEEIVLDKNRNKFQHDLNILGNYPIERLSQVYSPDNLAYVIYTSGSTGGPKGVVIEHRSVVNFIYSMYNDFKGSFSSIDNCLSLTRFAFDVSVAEYFLPLLFGSNIVLFDYRQVSDIELLAKTIIEHGITFTYIPPSLLSSVYEKLGTQVDKVNLNKMLVGVEPISYKTLEKYFSINKEFRIINGYGPTEATICATRYLCDSGNVSDTIVPIGRGLSNNKIYLLDCYNKLVPIGGAGEVCISGIGLSRGYLNNPDLTKEKFIDHPFKEGERLYRTGDLARWLLDGNIEFLGRIDHQVKIRGFRIELGEIENVLLKHENIKECIVTDIEENNEKYLCAYIVCKEKLKHEELRTYMSEQLPDYMVPSYFVELDKLPLTSNGKVNRKVLPSPQIKAGDDYLAPSNKIEEKLVEIWSEVLNIEKEDISVNANFFSIGGHSLKATVLTSNIHKEIGVEFPLREVFLHSTIKSQASQIEKSTKKEFVSIPKTKEQSNYPVSSAQKRLYLLQQFDLTSIVYNMPYIIPLGKEADKSKIEEVFKQLINRHESFRTSINIVDQVPVQLISKDVEFELEELSIEATEVENTRNKFIKPFDLSKAPFLRVAIVDIKGEDSLLMIDMHHIISDGTSHTILEKEFQTLFSGEELAPLPLQYKDYSQWQNSKEQQELIKNQEQYWLNKFEGEIPVLNLPTDYARPLVHSHEGATVKFILSKEETEEIRFFAEENDLTLYMSLQSVFNILLSKLSGQDDIVVGTPIAGRNHADLENIVGVFVNTLSIRNEVKGEETIRDFASSLKQTVLGAFENQNYQFEDLVDKVSVERDISHNPIFDVSFNLLNQAEYSGDLSRFNNQEQAHQIGISKFDLSLNAVDFGEQLFISFNYCTQLFKAETIDRFILYFKKIVSQFARASEIKIAEIDIITEAEKQQLLYEFNDTQSDYPKDKTVHQLFEEQVVRTPEGIALVFDNTELTYRELNQRANQLSHFLVSKGLKPGNIVGIMLDRSIEMIAGILAVLKAGGAYCPIDINNPVERKIYILEDSDSGLFLTKSSLLVDLDYKGEIVYADDFTILPDSNDNIRLKTTSEELAYLIYTSGTTGKPKGVMIRHDGVVNTICWYAQRYRLSPGVRLLQLSNYSFDASVNQIFGTLTGGATLYMIKDSKLLDLDTLYSYLGTHNITVINSVPAILEELISNRKRLPALQRIISGGEKLSNQLKDKIINLGYELHNHYGPTEATIVVLAEECSEKDVTLGKPKQNTQSYILSSYDQLQPIGVKGELCISGEGISPGYLNNEFLTKEKFISHPFKEGERLYRTGDLARWLPDGNIEFLGRIDHQVKIRGFRIELGEIESTLIKHEKIKESVVLAIEENNEKYLCAYVVRKEEFNREELRAYLLEKLPEYMVPSYFVELDSLPLTTNGKVNRKALPAPEVKAGDDYVAASTEIEEKLLEIWSEVLNIDKEDISVNANFFSIGGHSLKANILTGKIFKEIGVEFPLREVFVHPTVKSQASQIATSTKKDFVSIPKAKEQSNYPVSPAQKRMYLLQQFDPESTAYNMPNIIPLGKEADKSKIEDVFKQLINRHESFRTSFIVVDQEPVQHISKDVEFEIEELSIEYTDVENVRNKFIKPFDLSKAPLLRVCIVDIKGEGSLLMIDIHHIINDGVSHTILEKEFQTLYLGEVLPPLSLQFKDYAVWQDQLLKNTEYDKKVRNFWRENIGDGFPEIKLPYDFNIKTENNYSSEFQFYINDLTLLPLRNLANKQSTSLFTVVYSVFNILLSYLTGEEDVYCSVINSGRNINQVQELVGCFANSVLIKNNLNSKKNVLELIADNHKGFMDVHGFQDFYYEEILEEKGIKYPEVPVAFNMLNFKENIGSFSDKDSHNHRANVGRAKFDIELYVIENETGLLINWIYNNSLFKPETIEYMASRYNGLLEGIVKGADNLENLRIRDVKKEIPQQETDKICPANSYLEFEKEIETSIITRFKTQVAEYGEKTAIVYYNETYSYVELDQESNQIANTILPGNSINNEGVALLFEQGTDMIKSMLGVLKSGNYYIPLDVTYPINRLIFILKDSGARVIITNEINKQLATELQKELGKEIRLINIASDCKDLTTSSPNVNISPDTLAYVLYTSGSTGKPKGVIQNHRNVLHFIRIYTNNLHINNDDKLSLLSSYGFDSAVQDIYGALLNGASVHVYDIKQEGESSRIQNWMVEEGISIYHVTPTVYRYLVSNLEPGDSLDKVRIVVLGGEAVYKKDFNEYKKHFNEECIFINGLGSTESTLTLQNILNKSSEISRESVPVGFGVTDTEVYLEKPDGSLALPYEEGEIIIKSKHTAIAYLNSPEKTDESFVKEENGERILKTGDLGRYLADKSIEFIGRKDFQVKIRGNRVELGEVEGLSDRFPGISKSIVKYFKQPEGDGELALYYVLNDGVSIEKEELKKYIELQVPSYMVPMYFLQLEEFPYTLTGKIDRKALKSPEVKAGDDYAAPTNEIEEKLLEIWSEVLNTDKEYISVNSNFLDIGGNSFRALVLMSKIHKATNVEFPLKDMFVHTSIKAQAGQIEISTKKEFVAVPKAKEQASYPVSSAQKRLYLLQQFDLTSTAYNMLKLISLGKEADKSKIKDVFKQLINRHENFRTSFIVADGEPIQLISKDVEFELEELSIEKPEVENARNKFIKPFDLSKAPLLRVAIVDIKGEDSLLMIDLHHIISDGTSHTILGKEFQALLSGEELAPLPLQYKDYSQWQNSKEQQELIKDQEQYWLNKFEEEIPVLNLPMDYVRPSLQSHEGATVNFVLSKEETKGIRSFTKENDLTLFMSLLSVFNILLSKLTGQDDIIVGTPIAGRNHADLENIVGMFVNTLSIRNEVKGEETIQDFVSSVKQTVLGAFENQNYQFEDLVDKVSVERDASRNPIFDVVINLLNQAEYRGDISGFNNREQVHKIGISKFDLTLTAVDYGEQLMLRFEYCTQLFKSETIDRFIVYFKKIVNQLGRKAEIKISAIDILTEGEKHQLLYKFNNTKADYPKDKTVHQLFEEQVERTPENIAISNDGNSFTYSELNEKANLVAHHIREIGIDRDDIVTIFFDRSIETVFSMLGVLKSGGAYLPLDPDYPEDRIDFILNDSRSKIVISTKELSTGIKFDGSIICVEELSVLENNCSNIETINNSSDLCYIIYTSGTTGMPKGVMVEHKNLVRLFFNEKFQFAFSEKDIWTMFHSHCFDFSVWEMYGALLYGGKLIVIPKIVAKDVVEYYKILSEEKVTVLNQTPSAFYNLSEIALQKQGKSLENLRYVIFGGEALKPNKLAEWFNIYSDVKLINMYGITETTVHVTYKEIGEFEINNNISNIGTSIPTLTTYVVDNNLKLVPKGVAGELLIGGDGVSRGYLGREDLTREKFIKNPYNSEERLYRSGDLVKMQSDAELEYLGRIDDQVQLRGFRIELGEIENTLIKHESINECVVIAIEENNEKYLCAYVICKEEFSHEELRAYMSSQLPDYMVPSYFVELESLLLTANGKVNRKALPAPEIKAGDGYVAPANETEEKLAEIWSEVLNIEKEEISTTANFFSIGGHSLKVLNVVSAIKEKFGINLPLMHIYKAPNIKKIAIDILSKEFASNDFEVYNNENNNKVFCFPPLGGYGFCFAEVARLIPELCFYSFNFINTEDCIKFYADKIIEVDNQGSYKLLGYSAGCTLISLVAKELERRGMIVSDVILIDGYWNEKDLNQVKEVNENEVNSELEEFLFYIKENLKKMNMNFLIDEVREKIIGYSNFINRIKGFEIINARVHFIQALLKDENKEEKLEKARQMEQYTNDKFFIYSGNGEHSNMLALEFIEENVKIMRKCLSLVNC